MKSQVVLAAITFMALHSVASASGVDASYGFRSGAFYDGVIWPKYQLARQEFHGGFPTLSGDQFDTPEGVSFNNFTGNLAFFDRNNHQTRPAALIANEAWWTNVKTKKWGNNQEIATLAIGFINSPSGFANKVRFDIAVASPIEIPESISVTVTDPDNDAVWTYIDLVSADSGVTVEVESFTSLNSPFCYAARVHFDMHVLFADKMWSNPELNESNYGIKYIDLWLEDFATPNGLVQVAIDNLVVGDAEPRPILSEPFTTSNGTPSEPETPVSIVFTSDPPDPPAANTIYIVPEEVPFDAGFEATSYYESQFITSSVTAMPGPLTLDINTVLESMLIEGSATDIEPGANDLGTVVTTVSGSGLSDLLTGIQAIAKDIIDDIVAPTPTQQIIHDYTYSEDLGEQLGESILQYTIDELNPLRLSGGPPTRYFVNYSYEQYLDYLQQTGSPSLPGDAGYITIPVTNEDGAVTGYAFDFWKTGFENRSINLIFSAVGQVSPVAWRSVRTHSGAGPLSIALDPALNGNGTTGPNVEPRLGGVQQIEVDFDGPIELLDPANIAVIGQTTFDGMMGPEVIYAPADVSVSGSNTLVISFPGPPMAIGLPDDTCYRITLGPGTLRQRIVGDNDVRVRALYGDSTASGGITLSDVLVTMSAVQSSTPVASAPQHDVNLDGQIDLDDVMAVKARVASPAHQALCP